MFTISIFFGHASNAEARVYAQLQGEDLAELAGLTMTGTVVGPHSTHAHTLTAKIPFRFLGASAEQPLAEAIVPDPCFWTPESPNTYSVNVDILREGEVVQHYEQLLGIRPLGTRGRNFFFDARRWVVRGGFSREVFEHELADWREEQLALVSTHEAEDSFLKVASKTGLLVIGHLTGESDDTLARLNQLARWPAVGMVLVDTAVDESAIAGRPRNVLLGQRLRIDETNREFQPAAWANFVLGDVDDPASFVEQTKDLQLPVIAYRPCETALIPSEIRAACEQLQQDLAPHGHFAGYLV